MKITHVDRVHSIAFRDIAVSSSFQLNGNDTYVKLNKSEALALNVSYNPLNEPYMSVLKVALDATVYPVSTSVVF